VQVYSKELIGSVFGVNCDGVMTRMNIHHICLLHVRVDGNNDLLRLPYGWSYYVFRMKQDISSNTKKKQMIETVSFLRNIFIDTIKVTQPC
jgi:hypothetical protein